MRGHIQYTGKMREKKPLRDDGINNFLELALYDVKICRIIFIYRKVIIENYSLASLRSDPRSTTLASILIEVIMQR